MSRRIVALFFVLLLGNCLAVKADIESNSLHAIQGAYVGEIRLQSPDGVVNEVLVSHAELEVDVTGDEVVIKSLSDIVGKNCQSKIKGIRELVKFPTNQPQVVKAIFDFDSNLCQAKEKWDTLVVFIAREQSGALTLETLLSHGHIDLETQNPQILDRNVHGFFTKKEVVSHS